MGCRQTLVVAAVAALGVCALAGPFAPGASAFKISLKGTLNLPFVAHRGPNSIHEDITEFAILAQTTPGEVQLNRGLRRGIVHGTQNADITHQWDSEYHFDNSSVALGVGFAEGFAAIARHLGAARTLADGNEEFFRPTFASFREIADEVVTVFQRLAVSPKCLLRSACPTGQFLARAAGLTSTLASLRFNPNPDPHGPTNPGSPFAAGRNGPCDVPVLCGAAGAIGPFYKNSVDRIESHVDWALGRHGKRTLAELLGREHELVERLDRARRAIRAYRAFQDLGHAFHTTQDFFAHTNYVELMAGVPVGTPIPAGTQVPVPDDFSKFSLDGLRALMGEERFAKLESGYVGTVWLGEGDNCHGGPVLNVFNPASEISVPLPVSFVAGAVTGGGPRLTIVATGTNAAPKPGFNHCHYTTDAQIGLNKDLPGSDELSYANHQVARDAAKSVSELLWRSFLGSINEASTRCPQAVAACPAPSTWAGEWDVEAQLSTENEGYVDLGIITFARVLDKPKTARNEEDSALNQILGAEDNFELGFCFDPAKRRAVYRGFYRYTGGGTVVGCEDERGELVAQYLNTGGVAGGGHGFFRIRLTSKSPKRFQGTFSNTSFDPFFYGANLRWRGEAVKKNG